MGEGGVRRGEREKILIGGRGAEVEGERTKRREEMGRGMKNCAGERWGGGRNRNRKRPCQ